VGVILTAGVLEKVDEAEARRVEADAVLHKPFEASALLAAVRPLAERARETRSQYAEAATGEAHAGAHVEEAAAAAPFVAVVDAEQVRAAVTVALDASMERMVEEITRHVLATLESQEASHPVAPPAEAPLAGEDAIGAQTSQTSPADPEESPWPEPVRRVTPLRRRSGSILGLDDFPADEEEPEAQE